MIIIGSGLAAYMTAKAFREHDKTSPLILITEQDGDFYSKPQLSNAFKLNKQPDQLVIKKREQMAQELQAEIFANTSVTNLDPAARKVFLNNGESLEYDQLVLALGASPISLNLAGDAANQLLAVNDLQAYQLFRQHLAKAKHVMIIGTGLVGMEFANDWINAGYQVSMTSCEAQPLARLAPKEIGQALAQKLAAKGVQFYLENPVTAVDQAGAGYQVSLQDGEQVQADLVLSAIGIKPNIELAKKAGLATEQGIVVNDLMQTSDANIFAIGDCAQLGEVKLFIAPILHAAKCLGKTLTGTPTPVEYPLAPVMVKTPDYPVAVATAPGFQVGVRNDTAVSPHDAAMSSHDTAMSSRDLIAGSPSTWQIEQSDEGIRALASADEKLIGFALSGVCTKEKMQYLKEIKAQA